MTKGYSTDIEKLTKKNPNFRKVIFTTKRSQLVLMSLRPLEDIGAETHPHMDQFVRVEKGKGKATVGGKNYSLKDGVAVVIPAKTRHNIINTSKSQALKIYTFYTRPEHVDGTIHRTKADAEADPNEE